MEAHENPALPVGASVGDIKRIFLIEAGSIGFLGGTIGLCVGWASTRLINTIASIYFNTGGEGGMTTVVYIPSWLAFFAVGFATVVGLLSCLYPAIRAAKISPLSAIRQE